MHKKTKAASFSKQFEYLGRADLCYQKASAWLLAWKGRMGRRKNVSELSRSLAKVHQYRIWVYWRKTFLLDFHSAYGQQALVKKCKMQKKDKNSWINVSCLSWLWTHQKDWVAKQWPSVGVVSLLDANCSENEHLLTPVLTAQRGYKVRDNFDSALL